MTQDPYAAPAATLAEHKSADPVAMYTPMQVAGATFLAGPLALVHLLRANFLALGEFDKARQTVLLGGVLVPVWGTVLWFLPEDASGTPVSIAVTFAGYTYAERAQMKKQAILDSPGHFARSNRHVFGVALVCLAITVVAIGIPIAGLYLVGVLE